MKRLAVTLLLTGLLGGVLTPAWAADEIGLSHDGERWADTLTEPLFDADTIWVPGDSRTVSFYVRNEAESNALLTTTVRTDDADNLVSNDHIALRARAGGTWFDLRNGEPSEELTDASIRPGSPVKVEVEAQFDPRSSNASQAGSVDLRFEVRLTEAHADEPDDAPPPGWLPPTGARVSVALLWIAGILMVVGTALTVAARRERESEHV